MSDRPSSKQYDLHTPPGVGTAIYTACVVARRFRNVVPTAQQLMDAFGMSRAQSFRWRKAIAEANGIALPQGNEPSFPIPIPEER